MLLDGGVYIYMSFFLLFRAFDVWLKGLHLQNLGIKNTTASNCRGPEVRSFQSLLQHQSSAPWGDVSFGGYTPCINRWGCLKRCQVDLQVIVGPYKDHIQS